MSLMSEFKEFAIRGNVVDLAVGVIIGAAFGKIVSSFVDGVVMPIISMLVGGANFGQMSVTLRDAVIGPDGKETTAAVLLKYGAFLQTVMDFLIVALVIFLAVKAINRLKRKQAEAPAAVPAPSQEVLLLTEIRDALKSR